MRHDFPLTHSSLTTAWLTLPVLVLLLIYTGVRRDSGLLPTCPSWSENILQLSSEQLRMSVYLISIYEQSLGASPRRSSTVDKGHQLDCYEAPTNFGHFIFSLPNLICYSLERVRRPFTSPPDDNQGC